jgi:hypothetical protein
MRPAVNLREYLDACVQALRANNPVGWPAYEENPVVVWRYLARSIGYGLGRYEPIDNATFLGWMREAAAEDRRMEVNVRDG